MIVASHFQGALAKRLGAGCGLSGMILHAAEDFGRFIYEMRLPGFFQWRLDPANRGSSG